MATELKREIELLSLNIRNLRNTFDTDKLQIASKKKRLDDLHDLLENLQDQRKRFMVGDTRSPVVVQSDPLSHTMNLPAGISPQQNLDEVREAIRFMRKENEALGAQVAKNDALVRLGPNMGTLALCIMRRIEGRVYSDMQRREHDVQKEVNVLRSRFRHEKARLRAQLVRPARHEGPKNENAEADALALKVKLSKEMIIKLSTQKEALIREEKKLDTRIWRLQRQLNRQR